ncbi:hypothetical protein Droror1_Dr00014331 [Drosera rotundifolia]
MEMQSKGMMNPNHVAYMVDCYLARKKFCETRYLFRQEASFALANLILDDEAPEDLMTLEAILNEYVQLKRQKEMMDQQRHQLVQERNKIDALLQGMQQAMNAYNSGTAVCCVPLAPPRPSSMEISPATYANGMSALPAATPQVAAPICSAVFSTDVDNGRLGIDGSGLPTSQNVNNQGRNTSKLRHAVDYSGWTNDDLELVESLLSS